MYYYIRIFQSNKIIIKIEKIKYTDNKGNLKNIVEISRKKIRKYKKATYIV